MFLWNFFTSEIIGKIFIDLIMTQYFMTSRYWDMLSAGNKTNEFGPVQFLKIVFAIYECLVIS